MDKPERYALNRIQREWASLSEERRPWGVWIARFATVSQTVISNLHAVAPLQKVWFLTLAGFEERSPWQYKRIITIHWEQPWCKRPFGEISWPSGKVFEVGFASFAEYEEGQEIYLDVLWGRLCGQGCRVALNEKGEAISSSFLWVS